MAEKPHRRTRKLTGPADEPIKAINEAFPQGERLDGRGMRRQTLYLPPAVYEQIRAQTIHDRISQQEFFRRVFNFYFTKHGMKSWDELDAKARKPGK